MHRILENVSDSFRSSKIALMRLALLASKLLDELLIFIELLQIVR